MAQMPPPVCHQCGSPLNSGQRFCSNCGATNDVGFSAPTSLPAGSNPYAQGPQGAPGGAPPPPPESLYGQSAQQQYTYYPPQQQPQPQGAQGVVAPLQPAPSYARPQKDSSKGVLGQIGCGMLVIILLILAACGGLSYGAYYFISHANSAASTTSGSTTTSSSGNGTTTSAAATTQNIGQQVTYSSDVITIKSVQEGAGSSSTFSDDSGAAAVSHVVRLNVHENNPTTSTIYQNYSEGARLILPDKSTGQLVTSLKSGILSQGVSQDNWLDFQLSSPVAIDQLTLQLGTAAEAQMSIPLTGKADLSAYALKTIKPNTTFQYAGMNWNLTTVTSGWSYNGKQAASGQRYVVASLSLGNPTTNTYYFNASDATRLQGGSTTNAPADNTGPTVIAGGATNQSETITFPMPQNVSPLTLTMLAQTDQTPPISQYKTTFQI